MYKSLNAISLSLLHINKVHLDSSWQYHNVFSPFSRIYLITDGEGWVFHNNKKLLLKPGFLYLIPRFTLSNYFCDSHLEQYYIHFLSDSDNSTGIFDSIPFNHEVKANPLDMVLFERLLELNPNKQLKAKDPREYDNKSDLLSFNQSEEDLKPQNLLESKGILIQLFSRFIDSNSSDNLKEKRQLGRLSSTISFIQQNLQEKLTVEGLASRVFLTPDYFSKIFMEIMGIRPIDFINNKRLEKAQLLLITTNMSVLEVAENVGIPNLSYFSRLFKRRFGIPPARFRTQKWGI